MATIAIFASSLSVVSLLVLIKAIELKYNKRNFLLRLISKIDNKVVSLVSMLQYRSLQFIQSIRYIVLVHSKVVIREFIDQVQLKIINEYQNRQEVIMGRKSIVNKGSVSFYLKKIAENKGNGEKGMIVDDLEV